MKNTGDHEKAEYAKYYRYYPDKWQAISALRAATGMGFREANQIISDLFSMDDDAQRKQDDAQAECAWQQQEAAKAALKKTAKKAGIATGVGLAAGLSAIFSLAKKYK